MFNYAKNGVTINNGLVDAINEFNNVARELATKSVEANTTKKNLEKALDKAIEAKDAEKTEEAKKALDAHVEAWKNESASYTLKLYGGKSEDGKKTSGLVDALVTDTMYKTYVAYMKGENESVYKAEIRQFMLKVFNEYNTTNDIKQSVFNHFYADICTMSKKNSNKNIAEGCAFVSVVSKRTYKYMICGAVADILENNHTLKVAKAPKKVGEKPQIVEKM